MGGERTGGGGGDGGGGELVKLPPHSSRIIVPATPTRVFDESFLSHKIFDCPRMAKLRGIVLALELSIVEMSSWMSLHSSCNSSTTFRTHNK